MNVHAWRGEVLRAGSQPPLSPDSVASSKGNTSTADTSVPDSSVEIVSRPKSKQHVSPQRFKPSSYALMAAKNTPPPTKSLFNPSAGTRNNAIDIGNTSTESNALPSVSKVFPSRPKGQYVERLPKASPAHEFISSSSSSSSLVIQPLSAKERIKQEVAAFNKKLGVPLGAPQDPTRYSNHNQPLCNKTNAVKTELPEVPTYMAEGDAEKALKEMVDQIYADMNDVDLTDAMPESLKCTLLPHQVIGVQWMKSRELGKKRGGILADDMGLGKTVQSIVLIVAHHPGPDRPKGAPKATLIIGPLALLQQWKNEFEEKIKEGHRLKVLIYHGPGRTKDYKTLMKYDVVLTSYNTLSSEWPTEGKEKKAAKNAKAAASSSGDDSDVSKKAKPVKKPIKKKLPDPGPLFEATWHRVILDEAHNIKNRATKAAKSCYALQAKYRWCLTGTPIQNSVEDLFSLFCFMGFPKPFNEIGEFRLQILDPMKRKTGGVAMKRLQVLLRGVMLRRTKSTLIDGKPILELPPRNVEVLKTDFHDDDERDFYKAVQEKQLTKINKFIKDDSLMNNMTSVLTAILRLRQACNHPYLIANSNEASDKEAMIATQPKTIDAPDEDIDDLANALGGLGLSSKRCIVCQQSFRDKPACKMNAKFCVECDDELKRFSGLETSTKITQLMQKLEEVRKEDPKRKTIVFSQFTSMLDLVKPFLKRAKIKFVNYDGKMPIAKREESLQTIKEDPRYTVILVSFKCGSVGLNLTCCSVVCLLDLWWNPALENQAIDRAHRFGQTRAVDVYKFTIRETIEERILELQEQKMEIAKAAIDGGSFKAGQKLNMADVMHLFGRSSDD